MFWWLLFSSIVAFIAYKIWRFAASSAQYFEEKNIKYSGLGPAIYSFYEIFFGKFDFFGSRIKYYNRFSNESICGAVSYVKMLMFRDPQAYKRIAITDFEYFPDHFMQLDEKTDEILGNSLIAMHGEKWRQMRATLSPAFTGSKMRQMFDLISDYGNDLVKHFSSQTENGQKINVEMKDLFSRCTNDVIATCAFGIKVNSFADPDNEFYKKGMLLLRPAGLGIRQLIEFLTKLVLSKFLGLKMDFLDKSTSSWFKKMVLETMDFRQKNSIFRPDMINILMQVREGTLTEQNEDKSTSDSVDGFAAVEESSIGKSTVTRKWNDNEIIAQCILFFAAGFEPSSWAMTFAAHELLVNQDIQQKLYEEIAEVNEQLNGKPITYEIIQKMKYLDQVISETLRKWPVAVENERRCVKDYVYDDGERKFTIEKGTAIIYPVFGIQRDPKYFPEPDKFDPERFGDENKHKIVPGSYAPFGIGPRNCIGSRFALMEVKIILYYLLLNFSLEPNEDTQIPLKMKSSAILSTEKGVNLELKPRKKLR